MDSDGLELALVFLLAAVLAVPLFKRLGLGATLAYLATGVLLGPHELAVIRNPESVLAASEIGVVMLLFVIGLELSPARLKVMRRSVFGAGALQVALSAIVLGSLLLLDHFQWKSALIVGIALALSSTAVGLQLLSEHKGINSDYGRLGFAILLFQDLIAIPLLAAIPLLGGAGDDALKWQDVAVALGALALVILCGRPVLRRLFNIIARTRSPEVFTAMALLVVLGTAWFMQEAGLSPSLGAFLAGVLLSDSEFRHELESQIEPFKGLLLGVFFISVGIGLDLDAVAARPAFILGLAAGITALKAVIIFGLARAWGLKARPALETALVLGPAGEFAFVILATGMAEGVIGAEMTSTVTLAATLSIFATPFLAMAGQTLTDRRSPSLADIPEEALEQPTGDHEVLIVGFGRVGRLVGELLAEHGRRFVALDTDPATVTRARRDGLQVYYGDGAYPDMLERCGAGTARAVVVTMDAPAKVDEVVRTARALRSDLVVIARARDDRHAARLYELGATDAVPETTEASLQLAENTLVDLGVPMGLVLASIHERRDAYRQIFQAAQPEENRRRPTRALRSSRSRSAPPRDG